MSQFRKVSEALIEQVFKTVEYENTLDLSYTKSENSHTLVHVADAGDGIRLISKINYMSGELSADGVESLYVDVRTLDEVIYQKAATSIHDILLMMAEVVSLGMS